MFSVEHASNFEARPHIIWIPHDLDNDEVISRFLPKEPMFNRTNRYWVNHFQKQDSDASYENERRPWPEEHCVALGDWMTGDACNCNTIHEISMNEFYDEHDYPVFGYIHDGGFRTAWRITEFDGTLRVLKTLKFIAKRHFDLDNLERHRRDAIATEQLTASSYIADIYGHCAQSALVDYSDKVSMYHILKHQDDLYTHDELFQIAFDAVAAVADTHHFNKDNRATIVHHDIKPKQWIYLDGMYKLNEFNVAKFLSWNTEKNQHCGQESGYSTGRWQAPEQYHETAPLSEKSDV